MLQKEKNELEERNKEKADQEDLMAIDSSAINSKDALNTTNQSTMTSVSSEEASKDQQKKEKKKKKIDYFEYEILQELKSKENLPHPTTIDAQLKDQMHQEIENVGVLLGRRIIDNITKDLGSIHQTQTDIIKFICLSFWPYVFGKQIDKLKPSGKNSFILQDFNFKFLGRISS